VCLVALAWRTHPRWPLALIANRDELHARPSAPAGPDPDDPTIFGGRDLLAGGSWLLAATRGRLAAVTNVRIGLRPPPAPRSRGALVRGFVGADDAASAHLAALAGTAADYGPFNLLAWDGDTLAFAGNQPRFATHVVAPGLHAMGNGAFDDAWPKSTLATRALAAWLESSLAAGDPIDDGTLAPLFLALADRTPAPDDALPDTGVGVDLERRLSSPFVRDPTYGTRCSTVVLVEDAALEDASIVFAERRFGPDAEVLGDTAVRLPRLR